MTTALQSSVPMECTLVTGWRAYLAQGTLVVIIVISLVIKRKLEWPRRSVLVWSLDVSKQGLSSSSCHVSNLLFAMLASKGRSKASECSWYFIQYNVDNLIGVSMTILAHQIFIRIAKLASKEDEDLSKQTRDWRIVDAISQCGEYGDPPSYARWGLQATEWIASVITGRSISGMTTVIFRSILWYPLAEGLDSLFTGRPVQLVFFVLVIYPLCCGLLVSWIQDGILKIHNRHTSQAETNEPLLDTSERSPHEEIYSEDGHESQAKILDVTESIQAERSSPSQDIDSAYGSSTRGSVPPAESI